VAAERVLKPSSKTQPGSGHGNDTTARNSAELALEQPHELVEPRERLSALFTCTDRVRIRLARGRALSVRNVCGISRSFGLFYGRVSVSRDEITRTRSLVRSTPAPAGAASGAATAAARTSSRPSSFPPEHVGQTFPDSDRSARPAAA